MKTCLARLFALVCSALRGETEMSGALSSSNWPGSEEDLGMGAKVASTADTDRGAEG